MTSDARSPGEGGEFGRWEADQLGLPSFVLNDDLRNRAGLVLPDGDVRRLWHQVGNDRITATTHAGGWTTLYSAEAGLVRLSGVDPGRSEGLGGVWSVVSTEADDLASFRHPSLRATWHPGAAEWSVSGGRLAVRRRVTAPFGDLPALRADMWLRAVAEGGLPSGELVEQWGFAPYPVVLVSLMSRWMPPPSTHPPTLRLLWRLIFAGTTLSRSLVELARRVLGMRLALTAELEPELDCVLLSVAGRGGALPRRPTPLAAIPGVVFVAPLHAPGARVEAERTRRRATLARLRVPLPSGEPEAHFAFAVGIAPREEVADVVAATRARDPTASAQAWGRTWRLDIGDRSLARESLWHGAMLRGSQIRDAVLDASYVTQGSAYGFIHGLQGAPRDYAISCVPLVHLHPSGAKSLLRLMLRMTDPNGQVLYAHTGAGLCTSAGIHAAPSDLPIALLWALTEVVWATGDSALLDETIGFRPRRRVEAGASTIRERALLLWQRIRDAIGTGPNGLLRVGSGDWNDPIASMAPDRRAFHRRGESTYNSAFAAHALPRAAALLRPTHPDVASEILAFTEGLREAIAQTWTGRWFLRGHDGRSGISSRDTAIGRDHLFLDANAWCLIAGAGTDEMRRTLVAEIASRCDDPSPVGALALDRPHRVRGGILPAGWDTNGGVWAALNAFLAWGYSLHDPELAWRSLHKQSLAAHASAYPRIWYGIWSGPDAYNADYADQPGETFVQPATPMQEFPVMNSNAHAGPLLALLKVLGIEAGPEGFSVEPRVPPWVGPWRLQTQLVDVQGTGDTAEIASRTTGQ